MSTAARVTYALLLVAASVLCCYLVFLLWTSETPGWWFSLLFTVMLVGLTVALWAVYLAAIRTGNERERARSRWLESVEQVQPSTGVIVAREVNTLEDGVVHRFELTVASPSGDRVHGLWQGRLSGVPRVLQSQVPGVGASARVWRSPHATEDDPLVIEALDPSVGDEVAGAGIRKYVD